LLVPAFVTDLILQRTSALRPLLRAPIAGAAFLAALVAAQWPFASFLMTEHARNWVFGAHYMDFSTPPRSAYAQFVLAALTQMSQSTDPVAALAGLLAPDGRLAAYCRHCYEFRLHRARGYGALKAILSVLADLEPLNLTEISQRLHRTPGSTKDYLSWLEDVDLIAGQRKRYAFDDPVLRLYVRLYGHPVPPTDDDLVREVQAYAHARLPHTPEPAAAAVSAAPEIRQPGIIEID